MQNNDYDDDDNYEFICMRSARYMDNHVCALSNNNNIIKPLVNENITQKGEWERRRQGEKIINLLWARKYTRWNNYSETLFNTKLLDTFLLQ